ncbi:sigma-70 family RNA polymerase sigma factor [Sphingomonas sp.]|uniref:sigma-70 family RNA polymerase sigma factor n=1 Tax=Sphingomonas sp. TaxID=28214 RepID=UPI0035C7A01C
MSDAARARLADALVRTAAKDARAFQLVYNLSSAKLFGICLRICGERKAAEDVLQDVFATVWMRADRFDATRGTAITWLATIARNRAIDWRRAHGGPVTTSADVLENVADPAPSAVDVLLDADRQRLLLECMETLEQRQRAAIRSAFLGGFTYAELAVREAVPLGTMKSWVRRGLGKLRECLDGADA